VVNLLHLFREYKGKERAPVQMTSNYLTGKQKPQGIRMSALNNYLSKSFIPPELKEKEEKNIRRMLSRVRRYMKKHVHEYFKVDKQNYPTTSVKIVKVPMGKSQYEAYKSLNKHHIGQNFEIGKLIVKNQEKNNWGKSIVDTLSKDINRILDGTKGYSSQNLWRMRQFYLEYKDKTKLLELALTIPWGQNLLVMHKIKDNQEKEYYLNATDKLGWSRAVLLNQIKANAYQHHILNPKQSNFEKALPVHLSEQANEALKSEYNLDFLGITKPILERELENRLVEKIRDLILELGYGFSFIGNQYRLKLKQKEYFIDLLFYHRILKCLIAIELKTVEFEPEFAGKMNFYLELLDEQEKQPDVA
jgi:predicted nuclease of restriction endonuclease-like (RecB) superfamily